MRFHHMGCVVKSIAAALPAYRAMSSNIGEPILVASQKVRVCFVELSPGSFLELVEPASADSKVNSLLRESFTYYHAGFLVDDFDEAVRELVSQGATPLDAFHSEAFGGRRCQFFFNAALHLIELIEAESGQ
jgi:hypothetical protein